VVRTAEVADVSNVAQARLFVTADRIGQRLELRDELPRNPLGKILKRELRDELRN
jgi:acyl-CoA synthetase (AMP-forming)/AMP-acid ligase II